MSDSDDDGSEKALCQAYCVVYTLSKGETKENREWVCMHTGWAQVNLYEDQSDKTYRVVGWTLPESLPDDPDEEPDTKILVNSNVTNFCTYSKKSSDFLKYVDEDGVTFGFGFYKKDGAEQAADSAENPKKFYDDLTSLIDRLKEEFGEGEQDEQQRIAFNASTAKEGSHTVKFTTHPAKGTDLNIQKATSAKEKGAADNVSDVKEVKHLAHVKFDPKTRSYQGLPEEWKGLINQQFGLDINRLECIRVEGYKSRIPAVLEQMFSYLKQEKALDIEGIFRLAADQEEMRFVKQNINDNKFDKCEDVHCISTLLKVWFRELPRPLLDVVSHYAIVECDSWERAGEIVDKMAEPEGSVMLWLTDLCVEVAKNSAVNKMTPTNLGIVIGPNLFRPNMVDQMASLQYCQKVAVFLQKAIVWRARAKGIEMKDSKEGLRSNAIEKTF